MKCYKCHILMPATWQFCYCSCLKPTTKSQNALTTTLTPATKPTFLHILMLVLFLLSPTQNAFARLHTSSISLHGLSSNSGGGIVGGSSLVGISSGGSITGGSLSSKDSHVKTKDIEAVEGKSVSLPCPISSPLDDVYMVLWFRDNAGIPLYSFDVRDKMNSEQARHWSAPEVFGSRAKFYFDSQPATLEIKFDIDRCKLIARFQPNSMKRKYTQNKAKLNKSKHYYIWPGQIFNTLQQ